MDNFGDQLDAAAGVELDEVDDDPELDPEFDPDSLDDELDFSAELVDSEALSAEPLLDVFAGSRLSVR
ncbi:hypothetical protein MDOR_30210 [Mycolicibacterium doricum]|uniref:Uncharacterized protein n=1 Tax=Mycolicibacterium doricum TaxID=126673 RepID=A0A1X1TJF7_9MYCO|nr:hypothetical protein AWC01_03075 [Mycolicibacterium doricum]BBZ08852.1 hypothetical protein MDOR_30210 [Mycolicibacterium doricum]